MAQTPHNSMPVPSTPCHTIHATLTCPFCTCVLRLEICVSSWSFCLCMLAIWSGGQHKTMQYYLTDQGQFVQLHMGWGINKVKINHTCFHHNNFAYFGVIWGCCFCKHLLRDTFEHWALPLLSTAWNLLQQQLDSQYVTVEYCCLSLDWIPLHGHWLCWLTTTYMSTVLL